MLWLFFPLFLLVSSLQALWWTLCPILRSITGTGISNIHTEQLKKIHILYYYISSCEGRLGRVWETVLSSVPNSKISWLPSSAACHRSIEVHSHSTRVRPWCFLYLFHKCLSVIVLQAVFCWRWSRRCAPSTGVRCPSSSSPRLSPDYRRVHCWGSMGLLASGASASSQLDRAVLTAASQKCFANRPFLQGGAALHHDHSSGPAERRCPVLLGKQRPPAYRRGNTQIQNLTLQSPTKAIK